MYKNLLVTIPTERSPQPVIDGAISLATRCQAQLDAVAVGYESSSLPLVAEGGAAVASIFEVEREKALERAQAALAVFEAEARRAGLVHSSRAISALQGEAAAILGASARLYDLAVVAQPEFARDTFDNTLSQEILFQSGGPVLFMPYTFKGAFQAKRVGICWDGSRLAARAVRDGIAGTAMKSFASTLSERETGLVARFVVAEFVVARAPNTRYHTAANGWPDHARYTAAFPFATGALALDLPEARLSEAEQAGRRLFMGACISCHDRARVADAGRAWERK